MAGKYGIPYQGSKSRIADSLIAELPSGKRFVDLFGGGGAMTHCAALSGKYESVLYNEAQPNLVRLVKDAADGKYAYDVFKPEWISREEFFARKEKDAYVKYVWSFANAGFTYLYGGDTEERKRSAHNFVVFGIADALIESFPGLKEAVTANGIRERRLQWRAYFTAHKSRFDLQQLEALERLQRLEALERLQRDVTLEIRQGDYRDYEYEDGDVVYCDPPYEGAEQYTKEGFNHAEFYEWAWTRPYPVYFSSYDNISDKRFVPIWTKTKINLRGGAVAQAPKIEALFINKGYGKIRNTLSGQ